MATWSQRRNFPLSDNRANLFFITIDQSSNRHYCFLITKESKRIAKLNHLRPAETNEHEEAFVSVFIRKAYRERLMFELGEKRQRFLQRFNHEAHVHLDLTYASLIKPPNSDPVEIMDLLLKHGAPPLCYVMTHKDEIDRKALPLRDALNFAVGYGMTAIVSCVPGKLAYLETEQTAGPPDRYLLCKAIDRPRKC